MKVLYIVGTCLSKNTSANMSHNAYVQGLLENGCDVDIIMKEDSWGEEDAALPRFTAAKYYSFESCSFADKLKKKLKSVETSTKVYEKMEKTDSVEKTSDMNSLSIRNTLKKMFYVLFPQDPIYPFDSTWLKKALRFKSDTNYDLMISNSSPAASHKLAAELLRRKKINTKRWIQVWEDPWYYDLYGGHSDKELEEEHKLLRQATEVYYVSPLTLKYQQKYFSDCAKKMSYTPLPALEYDFAEKESEMQNLKFGYFGDYYSITRNLVPFYNTMRRTSAGGYIYGDSDLKLKADDRIEICGRVTLDKLKNVQSQTDVLVHLSNLRGGQIPGKIYHYSVTNKPILFILDGTDEEIRDIRDFFVKFDRYTFCRNNCSDIEDAIKKIQTDRRKYFPVVDFKPKEIVKNLLIN